MAGSLAAIGAAGVPAVALAVTPEERVRLALAELEAAFKAYYPRARVEVDFNGVTPDDMYSKPQPAGWSYAPSTAAALLFASVVSGEHASWYRTDDDDLLYGRVAGALAADPRRHRTPEPRLTGRGFFSP